MTGRKRLDLTQMSVGELLQALPGTHARAMTASDAVGPSGRDNLIIIEPLPPRRRSRADAAAYATERLEDRTTRRIQRTVELTDDGYSAREIGQIIATEEGSDESFAIGTVKGWRRRGRGTQP